MSYSRLVSIIVNNLFKAGNTVALFFKFENNDKSLHTKKILEQSFNLLYLLEHLYLY